MEINPGWVSAGAAVGGLVVTVAGFWIRSAFENRDERIKALETLHIADTTALKTTQTLLFAKLDTQNHELQNYKLHVAETYVNQAALEKLLGPIERRLETIEGDLRRRDDARG